MRCSPCCHLVTPRCQHRILLNRSTAHLVPQALAALWPRLKAWTGGVAWAREQHVQVAPPLIFVHLPSSLLPMATAHLRPSAFKPVAYGQGCQPKLFDTRLFENDSVI